MSELVIRRYQSDDLKQIVTLFRDTVHAINVKDYNVQQINAWAPEKIDSEKWGTKLLQHYTVVAELNGMICGFGDLHDTGYFDHLFVHKDYQGHGIATKIVASIEEYARKIAITTISVAVSITAKTYFLKQGYSVVNPQRVEFNGQIFTNYLMVKQI